MYPTTRAATRHSPLRRIPWHVLSNEQELSDQVWSALPEEHATRTDVERFLREEALIASAAGPGILYTYVDGPKEPASPVQTEWYLEFRFANEELAELAVEKRLLGP